MARPKILDVFDDSLDTGEVAYTRLASYAKASISGDIMTVQSNPTIQDGATMVLQVINSNASTVSRIQINSKIYTLRDSSGNNVSQVFPLNTRLSIMIDTVRSYAYLMNRAIPEGIIISEEDTPSDSPSINADTLGGYTPDSFALKYNTYNAYAIAEVLS